MKQRNQKFRKKKKFEKKKKRKFEKKKNPFASGTLHCGSIHYSATYCPLGSRLQVCVFAPFFIFTAPLALFMFHEQCIKRKIQSPFGNLTQHIFFTFQIYLHTFQRTFSPTHISKTSKIPYSNLITKRGLHDFQS